METLLLFFFHGNLPYSSFSEFRKNKSGTIFPLAGQSDGPGRNPLLHISHHQIALLAKPTDIMTTDFMTTDAATHEQPCNQGALQLTVISPR